jgi:hypothetical protein
MVHQSRDLLSFPHHSKSLNGLPVTTIERTLIDLGAVVAKKRLEAAMDDAVAARRTSFGAIGRCLTEVSRPGKRGLTVVRELLDQRGPGYVPPASALERMLFDAMEAQGEPPLRRQFSFPGRALPRGCVDGADPKVLLAVELDGRRWHTRISDLRRDHYRDNEAGRAGWLVLRLLYEDVEQDPAGSVRLIRETRATRRDQLGAESAA